MKQFFINLLSGSIKDYGESKLEDALQRLHDEDPTAYKAAIYGGLEMVKKLKPVVEKTENKIDDMFLDAVNESLIDSANKNNLSLD